MNEIDLHAQLEIAVQALMNISEWDPMDEYCNISEAHKARAFDRVVAIADAALAALKRNGGAA